MLGGGNLGHSPIGRVEVLPVVPAGTPHREVTGDTSGSLRVETRQVVGGVVRIHIGPVEAEVDLLGGLLEGRCALHGIRAVQLREADHRIGLVSVGSPRGHVCDGLSVHLGIVGDDAVHGPECGQIACARRGRIEVVRLPGDLLAEHFHVAALPLVEVLRLTSAA